MHSFYQTVSPAHPNDSSLDHAQHVLKKVYGYSSLRAHQRDVLKPFLQGQDTLAVIPTGGGKSMCYILPAMMRTGVGVVISPLISLIRDQVIKLRKVGIPAAALDSMQSTAEKNQVMTALHRNLIKVLYISPERLALTGFQTLLTKKNLCYLAVDEAHCVSEWGSDFRPEYRKLGGHFDNFDHHIPRLAVTATATAKVRQDIVRFVGLRSYIEIIRTPIRENLKIETKKLTARSDHTKQIIKKLSSSSGQGIIYTFSRKNTQRLTAILAQQQLTTSAYHAGLTAHQRNQTLTRFLASELKVVVATNAFGLGIDKKDIRFVHHYGLPPSLESYLQQIGRAGRDGHPSHCCLFYQNSDTNFHHYLYEQNYPSSTLITRIYETLFNHGGTATINTLSQAVYNSSTTTDKENWTQLSRIIEILSREQLIKIHSASHPSSAFQASTLDEKSIVMIVSNHSQLTDFIEVFAARKHEAKRKLNAMEHYANAKHNRDDVIRQYFDGC